MKYDPEEHRLVVDCEQDAVDPASFLKHSEARAIRFDNCAGRLVLPEELADLPRLESLSFYGKNREAAYPPPVNLEHFTGVKHLILWSYCELSQLPESLAHIESFETVVRDPFADTILIARRFPNLTKLEIRGSHLKSGELPPEIGDFARLEDLELVSCGLTDLPAEFSRLNALRRLSMRGLALEKFPEVICELSDLESLEFTQSIVHLPEDFSKLESLRKLDFTSAFNKGTMSPVDRWSDEKVYLHPIPDAIGLLPALEDLDLSMCGLVDLEFLQKNAQNIKRFRARYSALKNCDGFAKFSSLADLDLEGGEVLESIDGLAGLPITNLRLEGCGELNDLVPIQKLPRLTALNIEGCDDIRDLDAVHQHPALTTLAASEEILEQWKLREKFQKLRPVEEVVAAFAALAERDGRDDRAVAEFETAVADLKLYVDKNYHDEKNPLAGYFGREADNYEIVHLPALEAAFEKHKARVSIGSLVALAQLSLRAVSEDNYEITLLALREINRRAATEAQLQVVKIFQAACEYYDFGHRFMESTVHDQLFDEILPEFSTAALIELLRDAHGDMMNSNGGDQADLLFVPAFQNFQNEAEFAELLRAFFSYQDQNIDYHGAEYFGELQEGVRSVLSGEYLTRFQSAVGERAEQTAVLELIESNDVEDKVRLIEMLPDLPDEFIENNDYKILRPLAGPIEVPKEAALRALEFFIRKESAPGDVPDLILKYMLPDGARGVIGFLESRARAKGIPNEYVADLLKSMIRKMDLDLLPMSDIQRFRDCAKDVGGLGDTDVYAYELLELFKVFTDHRHHNATNAPEKLSRLLDRMDEIVGLVREPFDARGLDFKFDLYLMASHADDRVEEDAENGVEITDWDVIKRICAAFFPIIAEGVVRGALYLALVAAAKTRDLEYFESMEGYIPEKITEELLAYNLACACATFEKKEAMLKYVARSIKLGKTPAQFKDDPDFTAYLGDADFLEALKPVKG